MGDGTHGGRRGALLRAVEIGYMVEIGPCGHMGGFPAAIVRMSRPRRHGEEELKAMDFRS